MKLRPSTIRTLCRTLNAVGVTPRTTTFTEAPSFLRCMLLTTMISGDASGRPSSSLATRASTMIVFALSRLNPDVNSEVVPRWMTMALSVEPVDRRASRKPFDMATRTSITATTRAMPPMASRVTRQRTTRLRTLYEIGRAIRPA